MVCCLRKLVDTINPKIPVRIGDADVMRTTINSDLLGA